MANLIEFLKKIRIELKKVTWPNWTIIKSSTIAVVITSLFFGVYIGLVDFILKQIFEGYFLK